MSVQVVTTSTEIQNSQSERIEKDTNMKSLIEKKEDKWIKSLKTYVPFGFNWKLNHPTWK